MHYFKRTDKLKIAIPSKLYLLSECQLQQVNNHIQKIVEDEATTSGIGKKWLHHYNKYSAKERADIGKYASENGTMKAFRHFTKNLGKPVAKSIVKRLKATRAH